MTSLSLQLGYHRKTEHDKMRAVIDIFEPSHRAFLFDMDGVLTDTATLHARAWKMTFDEFLFRHAQVTGEPYQPFGELRDDYHEHVDGKMIETGVRDFLASRNITVAEDTIDDIGNRKNELFDKILAEQGVFVFEGSIKLVKAARERGIKTVVVSSSRHTQVILEAAGISELFDARLDGTAARALGLAGKPAPDMFVEGAKRVAATPQEAVVFEDALAGVAAGKAGHFAFVVGVNRHDEAGALLANGADFVVSDLAELIP